MSTIRFGNGSGHIIEDNILTNPEDYLSLPLLGKNYTARNSLDPKKLLNSDSLGVSPAGKTLTIRYKHGGGTSHNIGANTIDSVLDLKITYPRRNVTNRLIAVIMIRSIPSSHCRSLANSVTAG